MADQRRNAGERFDEDALHSDFRHYYQLTNLQQWAIVTEDERHQLNHEIDAITRRWLDAPSPWTDHWEHLATSAQRWETDPQQMQRFLDRIAADYTRTGTTDLASGLQVRSLILAGELVESRRTDIGFASAPTPDQLEYSYGYVASYRTPTDGTTWNSLSSWASARQWLIARAADSDPDTPVDITITGPDPRSGAASRPLMTGTGLTAAELSQQLQHIEELLGTPPIPTDPSAHSWLDQLRYEVLCDAYRATLLDERNPWAVGRRFEHHLHADDLRSAILDYGDRAGFLNTEALLGTIRGGVRTPDWTTAPRTSTWLDDTLADTQRHLDDFTTEGLRLTFVDPDQPELTTVGFDGRTWYLERGHTAADHRTITYDTPPATFAACDELLAALSEPAPALHVAVPECITSQLRTFDAEHRAVQRDLACVRQIRDAIRGGAPYTLRRQQELANCRPRTPQRSAVVRDVNRITTADAPQPEPPAPPKPSMTTPPPKRRQRPKSAGRQHRRRL
ncbi:hypothetical protein [Nocardia brasiliensis]|uniref:hypothetical protein n=1 Tax=Nocardia brasiliensis TaxID=37326 RepID=UPI0033DA4A97